MICFAWCQAHRWGPKNEDGKGPEDKERGEEIDNALPLSGRASVAKGPREDRGTCWGQRTYTDLRHQWLLKAAGKEIRQCGSFVMGIVFSSSDPEPPQSASLEATALHLALTQEVEGKTEVPKISLERPRMRMQVGASATCMGPPASLQSFQAPPTMSGALWTLSVYL